MTNELTLIAMKNVIEEKAAQEPPRPYLGASSIGEECLRKQWYQWRWFADPNFDADTLCRFDDGHRSEDIVADRLRAVEGIILATHNDEGDQYGFSDIEEHFKGHYDGIIYGLKEDPERPHLWEAKAVNQKSFDQFVKLKTEDESTALEKWNPVYYAQAVVYMYYQNTDRHYLTVSTAGSRDIASAFTDRNDEAAEWLICKAQEIICSPTEPLRAFKDPSFYKCKWCSFSEICWFDAEPKKTCRSCKYSKPIESGRWACELKDKVLSFDDQLSGCQTWSRLS